MGLRDTGRELYRRANDSFGRHGIVWAVILFVLPFVSLGALAAYLASTAEWYWQHFGWLGVFLAVLVTWVLLGAGLLLFRALVNPTWLRLPEKKSAPTQDSQVPPARTDLDWWQPMAVLETFNSALTKKVKAAEAALEIASANATEASKGLPPGRMAVPGLPQLPPQLPTPQELAARAAYTKAEFIRSAAATTLEQARNERLAIMLLELERGKYIAQGLTNPRSPRSPPVLIPKEEWRLLYFDRTDETVQRAKGGGSDYLAIRIAKAD